MINDIRLLQVELGEHIEVENELAKRSYFCNKVIKKYKQRIQTLNEEIQSRQGIKSESHTNRSSILGPRPDHSQDLTNYLRRRINDYEQKQRETQAQLDEI